MSAKAGARAFCVAALVSTSSALAVPSLATLATFSGDGKYPYYGVVADAAGNLYGTTTGGGSSSDGTVFEVAAGSHALSTLATFSGLNGSEPQSGLIVDAAGNLYGTTYNGGASTDGIVFEVAAGSRTLSTLATFTGPNGSAPAGNLIADAAGNLYGTTSAGGGSSGNGTVFEVAAGSHLLSTLATFNGTNGREPTGGLVADAAGNLYGTTYQGGSSNYGTVFEVAAGTHALSTIATFTGVNGLGPAGTLIVDAAGNLYGTTVDGGAPTDGTVFEVAAGSHVLSTLATFTGTDGSHVLAGLTADAAGNLYGTTDTGGAGNDGTVFEVAAAGHALTTLATFTGVNGASPKSSGLIADAAGNLYGTTSFGGSSGVGNVFELSGTGFVAIPEPGPLSLVGIGTLNLLRRRRHPRNG